MKTNSQGQVICQLCGEPMPPGEEMFNYHGYSGPCPRDKRNKRPPKIVPPDHVNGHDTLAN